jgi:uncharacterized repeat protein (TIGR02543 family)
VVIGFAPANQSGLPGGRFQVLDDDYSHLAWGQVDWPEYNAANGETRPAVGDIDGDGKAEILIGLGTGGEGLIELFRIEDAALSPIGWTDIHWREYSQANGETWPAMGDIDGDGRSDLAIGLGRSGAGNFLIKKGFDEARLTAGADPWIGEDQGTLTWTDYAKQVGETRPAVGDLNGDGKPEIAIGLGPSGAGQVEVFDYLASSLVYKTTLQAGWPDYNAANGETRPVIGNIDSDRAGEIMIGLGTGGDGYVDLFDDALTQFNSLNPLQLGSADYQRNTGSIWPAFKHQQLAAARTMSEPPATVDYQLSVLKNGTGDGTIGGGGRFASGTSVTPTATAIAGSIFAGWTPTTCATAFALTADTTCTATFNLLPTYALSVSRVGSGAVTSLPTGINCGGDCKASFVSATAVTLTPTPAAGYTFTGWSGVCTGAGACQIPMGAARTVTATFKAIPNYVERGITAQQTDAPPSQVQTLSSGPDSLIISPAFSRAVSCG